jgi:hypothetical protein
MWNFLDRAELARQAACERRRHLGDHDANDMAFAMKLADRFEAHAAELEYRWLTLPPPSGPARPRRLWFISDRR